MVRKKSVLTPEEEESLKADLLNIVGEGQNNAKTFQQIEDELRKNSGWQTVLETRVWDKVQQMKKEGVLSSKRRVGFWKNVVPEGEDAAAKSAAESPDESAAEKIPAQKSSERGYYSAIKDWLQNQFECYAEDVSERGKRGYRKDGKGLVAVPDVVGVRYRTGQSRDQLEVIAVEVKVGKPISSDISEAFRYSRFADLCYIAYDADSIGDGDVRSRLLEEVSRLGIGVLQFPVVKGKGKRIIQVRPPTKQKPDDMAKDDYLARKLDIYECLRCHTYHFVEDSSKLIEYRRSDDWLEEGALSAEEQTVKRYVCDKCKV